MDGYIRGMHEFKVQFLGRFIESIGVIAAFIVTFIVLKQSLYSSYVITLVFGSLLIIIFYSSKIRSYFSAFDYKKLLEQLAYGKLFILATTLGTIFLSLDKVIINKYIGPFELGLYGAYYTASITLVAQMAQMFNNVFFPAIAKNLNRSIFNKIEKLVFISFVPLFVIITMLVFLVIKIYGSKYGVHMNYVLLFGLLGTIQIIQAIYNSVIINLSKAIYKKYLFQYNILNALTVAVYGILIIGKHISIQSIAIVLLGNYIILLFLQRKLIKENL
jgi:O-antigen/teichoic acid export membrane protein